MFIVILLSAVVQVASIFAGFKTGIAIVQDEPLEALGWGVSAISCLAIRIVMESVLRRRHDNHT